MANSLLIQPVYAKSLGGDWNEVLRAIVPLNYVKGFRGANPELSNATIDVNNTFGRSEIKLTGYFSPKKPMALCAGEFIWGADTGRDGSNLPSARAARPQAIRTERTAMSGGDRRERPSHASGMR